MFEKATSFFDSLIKLKSYHKKKINNHIIKKPVQLFNQEIDILIKVGMYYKQETFDKNNRFTVFFFVRVFRKILR